MFAISGVYITSAKVALLHVEGSKVRAYCRRHAEKGMTNVSSRRCSQDSCAKRATSKVEGGKMSMYCKEYNHQQAKTNCKSWTMLLRAVP